MSPSDPLKGFSSLMRSLITQLILCAELGFLNLELVQSRKQCEDLSRYTLQALCWTFHCLVRQVPDGLIIFCIVDRISEY
ncbi:hypothetical protein K469DRAFT_775188, partial [Zopfia rhizophila CBS 207.26]